MTKTHQNFSLMVFTISLLNLVTISATNALAVPLSSNLNSETSIETENHSNKFLLIYQGKCDRNPRLPGC